MHRVKLSYISTYMLLQCGCIFAGNQVKTAVMLLELSLFVLTAIQLTSSQPNYDVIRQYNEDNNCERTEQVLRQLVTAVSKLHTKPDVPTGGNEDANRPSTQPRGQYKYCEPWASAHWGKWGQLTPWKNE